MSLWLEFFCGIMFNKYKIYLTAFFTAVFFTFSGYYVLLMLVSNLVGNQYSQYFTIPVRLLIVALLFICFMLLGKKKHLNEPVFITFIVFSLLYITRIAIETLNGSVLHMSSASFLLYFMSFCFLPFLLLFIKKDLTADVGVYKWAILVSGLILSLTTLLFYRDIIGTVGRISLAVSRDENYISPLALSYTGALTMGVALLLFFTNSNSKSVKLLLLAIAGLSCVPFFLGASRGSVLALSVPFILFILNHRSKLTSLYLLIVFILLSFGIVVLSEQFGSALIERFAGIDGGLDSGSTSASRVGIWASALNHFSDNPLFGSSLELPETQYHPHNVFIEVLLSTGIIGFIPFMFLIAKAVQHALHIFKNNPEVSWVAAIFLQSIIQNCFSGSIYGASWLFFSMAFVLSMSLKPEYASSQNVPAPKRRPQRAGA